MIKSLGTICLFGVMTLLTATSCAETKKTKAPAIPTVTLNNGVEMPMLGLGTMTLEDTTGMRSVVDAIALGYRLFDSATIYNSEDEVGEAIRRSGIDRRELFLTSKLWVDDMGYEGAKKAFARTLENLGTDYLDLYLIHRPRGDVKGSWQAMEELYAAGKIRAIGVSNFTAEQLAELAAYAKVSPAVNQIESSPYFQEREMQDTLRRLNIQMEAWAQFAEGRNGLFTNPVLVAIGEKHHKSVAQVILRWLNQRGIVAIPRATKYAHLAENLQIFDFQLDDQDMQRIAGLETGSSQFPEWN